MGDGQHPEEKCSLYNAMRYGVLVLNTCLSEEKAERLSIVGYGVNPVGRPDATNKQTNMGSQCLKIT